VSKGYDLTKKRLLKGLQGKRDVQTRLASQPGLAIPFHGIGADAQHPLDDAWRVMMCKRHMFGTESALKCRPVYNMVWFNRVPAYESTLEMYHPWTGKAFKCPCVDAKDSRSTPQSCYHLRFALAAKRHWLCCSKVCAPVLCKPCGLTGSHGLGKRP